MSDTPEIAAIRERWGKATKGPWLWAGSNNSLELMAARGWGDVVMAFRRWGMQQAQPAFVIDGLIYDVARGKGGKSLLIRPEAHNQWKIRGIDHPDAIAIAAAPTDVATLLAALDEAQAQIARDAPALAAVDEWHSAKHAYIAADTKAMEAVNEVTDPAAVARYYQSRQARNAALDARARRAAATPQEGGDGTN